MTNMSGHRGCRARAALLAMLLTPFAPQAAWATASGCATVAGVEAGKMLELRAVPRSVSPVVTQLRPGEAIWIDDARCTPEGERSICDDTAQWTHVEAVERLDLTEGREPDPARFTKGWIPNANVKAFDCNAE